MLGHATFVVMGCTMLSVGTVHADDVEIYLSDMLDNTQDGYCIDIARARGEAANPDDGLQDHTCYSPSGELMVDQIFGAEKIADGVLCMPEFDVCAELPATDAGAAVALAGCDGGEMQAFAPRAESRCRSRS